MNRYLRRARRRARRPRTPLLALGCSLAWLLGSGAGGAAVSDSDGDGVPDSWDNCQLAANPDQQDANLDGFGDACDPDCDDDGIVSIQDLQRVRQAFGSWAGDPRYDPPCDVDGTGAVGLHDWIFLARSYAQPPGPSGLACALPYHDGSQPCEVFGYTPYGIYPDCLPPAVPIESQAWWHETAAPLPSDGEAPSSRRHVHIGMCSPNARDLDGGGVSVRAVGNFVAVVILHNNPGVLEWVGMKFQGHDAGGVTYERRSDETFWSTRSDLCSDGSASCVTFDPPLSCPVGETCRFEVPMRIDFRRCEHDGLCELRIRPNLSGIPPRGDRQFTTNNSQVSIVGPAPDAYRHTPAPIGRGWYTGLQYANASIENYMELFEGRSDLSVPVVSGTIDLDIEHRRACELLDSVPCSARSVLRIDPNAHQDLPGILVYDLPGAFEGVVSLDTRTLANGRHALVLETVETNEFGSSSGLLKLFIDVEN